jgi:hypothetical protein
MSTSICIVIVGSASGEGAKVDVINKKEDIKVDNLEESSEHEFEEYKAVGNSSNK